MKFASFKQATIGLALLITVTVSFGQLNHLKSTKKETSQWSAGAFYDQDYTLEMFGLKRLNEDRNYTMGLGVFVSSNGFKKTFLFRPLDFLNKILTKQPSLIDKDNSNPNNKTTILLGNGSFTPDSLPAYYIIHNDRPYGSITYLQFKRQFTDYNNLKKWNSYLNVGVIGSNISRDVQTAIHKSMNEGDTKSPRTPRGWPHQISQGGEFTLLYFGEKESLLSKKLYQNEHNGSRRTQMLAFECKHSFSYGLGYYTFAGYNFSFRTGLIDPRNWTYEANPLSGSNKGLDPYLAKPPKSEYYLFASLRPTFILYNAMLNGQFRKSDYTLSFADMNHGVLEFDAGLTLAPVICQSNRFDVNLKFSGRSPEFELSGRAPRWHYWGGLDFIYSHF